MLAPVTCCAATAILTFMAYSGTADWYTFEPACGIPVHQYFWLDYIHPTFPMHNTTAREIAALIWQDKLPL